MYQDPSQQPWQPQNYTQPTAGYGPLPGPPPRPPRKKKRVLIILGIVGGALVFSCILCTVIVSAFSHPSTTATPTATPGIQQGFVQKWTICSEQPSNPC